MFDQLAEMIPKEEAAAVKAQIVIKKGGNFATEEDVGGNMLAALGLSAEDMADVQKQFDDIMEVAGVGDANFTGYRDNEIIKVQLNPNSYTIKSKTNFKSESMGGIKTSEGTIGTFGSPAPRELSVKLFYDTLLQADYLDKIKNAGSEAVNSLKSATGLMSAGAQLLKVYQKYNGEEDLNKLYLDKLFGLTRVLQKINTPALISFNYGSTSFEGYVMDVSVEYERFNKQGEVVRAEVTLTIQESNIFAAKEASGGAAQAQTPELGQASAVLENSPI